MVLSGDLRVMPLYAWYVVEFSKINGSTRCKSTSICAKQLDDSKTWPLSFQKPGKGRWRASDDIKALGPRSKTCFFPSLTIYPHSSVRL